MQFAKLFERDGRQVLVTKEASEDDHNYDAPIIKVRTKTTKSGHDLAVNISFKGEDDVQTRRRDEAFDKINADMAFGFVETAAGIDL